LLQASAGLAGPITVEFPGPLVMENLGQSSSAISISWGQDTAQYLVAGDDVGFLNLVRTIGSGTHFGILTRLYLEGEITALIPWENPGFTEEALVAVTRNPDRLHFIRIQTVSPYMSSEQQLDLSEDPGGLAFTGPVFPGGQELAVSLPGMDQVTILVRSQGVWSISQVLDAGDDPQQLAGIDLDHDGIRELITADTGVLSKNLGHFQRQENGEYSRVGQFQLDGWPALVRAYDYDLDGQRELFVGFSDIAEMAILEAVDGQLETAEVIPMILPPESLHLFPLPDNSLGMFSTVQSRGLVEYHSFAEGAWEVRDSYYPGCWPSVVTSCDFNGEGFQDLVCLGAEGTPNTVLYGNTNAEFWGFPALTLNTTPGSSVLADFNLDGINDLVMVGEDEPLLSFFAGQPDGSLATSSTDVQLEYLAGGWSPWKPVPAKVRNWPCWISIPVSCGYWIIPPRRVFLPFLTDPFFLFPTNWKPGILIGMGTWTSSWPGPQLATCWFFSGMEPVNLAMT